MQFRRGQLDLRRTSHSYLDWVRKVVSLEEKNRGLGETGPDDMQTAARPAAKAAGVKSFDSAA
jgi:hypothetical protein